MNRRFGLLLIVLVLLTGLATAAPSSQITNQQETDPNASITFPPPVYVVRGQVEVRGTANVQGMLNYFIEFRRLNENLSTRASDDWIPATLPTRSTVQEGVLGVWDTTTTPDGLYELRLTVNVPRRRAITSLVSPIRVENNVSPFAPAMNTPLAPQSAPTIVGRPTIIGRPTLRATPTAFVGGPSVTAITDANVRQGDSVNYPIVGPLLTGQTAEIVGISSVNGWYYIQLGNGRRGFISPSVVNVTGNVNNLQIINPPATPTPTFTPTPPATGDLLINGHELRPDRPRCNEQFDVLLNVTNAGNLTASSSFVVRIEDVDVETGTITASSSNTVPVLMAPGQNFVVVIPITVSTFPGRDHRITATVDVNNQVLEQNEGNNQYTLTYRLRQANCP